MAERPTYEELESQVKELKTDYSHLKQELHEARLFSEDIMRYMTEGLVLTDTRETVIFINQRLSEMLGYLPDQIIGKSWLDMVSAEHRASTQEALARRAQGHTERYEIALSHKDGHKFPVFIGAGPRFDKQSGEFIGTMGVVNDITERKQADEALRDREERYRLIFNMGANAMFLVDSNTTQILECNNKASQMFGYSFEELLSMKMTDLSKTPEATLRACQENVSKKERVYRKKDGEEISVDITSEHFHLGDRAVHISAIRDVTDKKLAEEALQEKTKFLHNIIDTTSDLVAVTDMEGNFTFLGPSHRFLGYDPDSLVGRNVMEFVHPDDYQETAATFAEFLANREDGRKVECRYRRSDGEYIWFETVGRFILDDAGNPKEILFSSRDFTARKKVEEALKENEQKFRTIFNSNMDSITLLGIGPDGKPSGFIDCNDAACHIFGYTREELMLKKLEDLEREVPEKVIIQRLESLKSKGSVDFETVIKDKNGNDRYVEVKAVLMNLANQPAIMNISRDITERKQTEMRLKKSEEQFRNLYDDAPVGYFEYDLRGNITRVNLTHSKLLGYTAEEMIGQPCWKFIVDKVAREQILDKLRGARPPAVGLERTYRRKDGTTFPVLFEDRLLTDEEGHITGIRTAIQDITDRKRAEAELKTSEEKYRILFQSSKDPVYIATIEGTVMDANPAFFSLFGYTTDDLDQLKLEVLYVNPDNRAEFIKEVNKSGFVKDHLEKLRTKDDCEMDCLITATIRRSQVGDILGYQGTIRDITEVRRKQLEKEQLISELQDALAKIKTLSGLVPICAHCKNIRDDEGYWKQIEDYLLDYSDARFSHGICPECAKKFYPDMDIYDEDENQ